MFKTGYMRRAVTISLAVLLTSAASLEADTLTLGPGGYLSVSGHQGGPVLLVAPEGFSFQGGNSAGQYGSARIVVQCDSMQCTPGATVTIDANFSGGNDTTGTATYQGVTYNAIGSVSTGQDLNIDVTGSVVMPAMSDSATVTAPFSLTGRLGIPNGPSLTGSGTAVLTLRRMSAAYPNNWAVANITYYISSWLPDQWAAVDVGTVGQPGTTSYDNGTFHVAGSGADIWGSADAFQYAFSTLTGDVSISARVVAEQNTDPFAKAGVMLRTGFDAGAPQVLVDVRPDGSIEFMTRAASGGSTSFIAGAQAGIPVWVRLTRSGDVVTGSYSSDGISWTQLGSANAPSNIWFGSPFAGLVATSHNTSAVNEALFDHVSVQGAASQPPPLPSPWTTNDIGNTGVTGSAAYDSGTFRVAGAGPDIWGTADAFRYVWQPTDGTDVSLVTRVLSQDATNPYAKAGLMIRASQSAGAADVVLDARPDGSVEFMTRATDGGQTTFRAGGTLTLPAWLKLERAGNQVTGSTSQDGSSWSPIGTVVLQADFSAALIGLAVTSHDSSRLNTAVFDSITVGAGSGSGTGSGTALDRSSWTVFATESAPADPPANAIDGSLNTRFSTGNPQHDSQGFIVSWSGDQTIARIRMDVGPSVNDYPRTCGIWVKDAAGGVTFVNCAPDANGNVDVSFAPIPASKIEVWQWGTSSSWWSIAEFNVFKP